jgi:hypothetical protein
MSAGGILASMNFPSFSAFSGRVFSAGQDKDLALAVLRPQRPALDERAGTYPGRSIPMTLPVLWGEVCAEEGPQGGVPRALPDLLYLRPGQDQAQGHDLPGQHRLGMRLPALGLLLAVQSRRACAGSRDVPVADLDKVTYQNAMR